VAIKYVLVYRVSALHDKTCNYRLFVSRCGCSWVAGFSQISKRTLRFTEIAFPNYLFL